MDDNFDFDLDGIGNARAVARNAQILLGRTRHAARDGRTKTPTKRTRITFESQTDRTQPKHTMGKPQQRFFRQPQKLSEKVMRGFRIKKNSIDCFESRLQAALVV